MNNRDGSIFAELMHPCEVAAQKPTNFNLEGTLLPLGYKQRHCPHA